MTKKRIVSAALAGIMALSSLSVLSSCNKDVEPIKEKRTNVYSGVEIKLPEGINYINRITYANNTVYATYYKEYTITYNELGEEVERREGYFYEDYEMGVDEDMIVEPVPYVEAPVEEVVERETIPETEAAEEIIDADGDGIADATVEIQSVNVPVAATAIMVETAVESAIEPGSDNTGEKLPEGWWFGYENVQCICAIPIDGGEYREIPLEVDEKYGYLNNINITADGNIMATTSQWEYDEELGMSTSKFYILIFDMETGETISANLLNDAFTEAGIDLSNTWINSVTAAPDGRLYISTERDIIALDSNLAYQSINTIDDGWINQVLMLGNKPVVVYYSNGYVCKYIENGEFVDMESETLKSVFDNYWGIIGATEDKIYYQMSSGIYVYDFATDTTTETLNFINSDIDSNNTGNMIVLEDGRIIMASTDWSSEQSQTTLQILSKVPDEQLEEEIIVRVGCTYTDYYLTKAIIRYNKQNTGVRIAVVSYDQYNNEDNNWNGAVQQLNNDIITGKMPDIIYLNTSLPVESYFQKGIFADLNPYIDDPEKGLNRDDYLANVLEANSVDGKLYSMILSFRLQTLVAKSEFVGTEPGWTFEEMMACISSMPEGMLAFFDMGRDDIVNNFFSYAMGSFVDWETGTTKFESQGFIDLIKYLATCPEKGLWDEYYESMGDEYVYDEEKEREIQEKYSLRFYSNYGLFSNAYISNYTAMLNQRNNFASTDITAIGYPTENENSNGAIICPNMEFAISATSRAKDEAWEIIKFFMTDEEINSNTYNFSINKKINEENYKTAEDNYYYYDNSDDDFEWEREYGYSEEYINYLKQSNQKYDQAAVDEVKSIVEGAGEVQRTDTDLVEIINEELSTFFAGTRSAEETARIIASRASIYISENS